MVTTSHAYISVTKTFASGIIIGFNIMLFDENKYRFYKIESTYCKIINRRPW